MVSKLFEGLDMAETQFINVNLYNAHFEDVNLKGTIIHNANLTDVKIYDANIRGLTIFDIRVDELIEAEFDRRDPERVNLRMKDIHSISEVRRIMVELNRIRAAFKQKLNSLSTDILNNHPGPDRWSALEHVRHLVFAEDLYLNRWILRNDKPWIKLGCLPPFLYQNQAYADVGTEPTIDLDKVLKAWHAVHSGMETWVENAQSEHLRSDTSAIAFGQETVGAVFDTLFRHDLEHIRMAEKAIEDSSDSAI